MKYAHEIVGTHGGALLLGRAPGACSRSKIPRVQISLKLMTNCLLDVLPDQLRDIIVTDIPIAYVCPEMLGSVVLSV